MPRKSYELIYQDGSKEHIDRSERDDLVLSGHVKQVGRDRYEFTGQARTYHSFVEYGKNYTPPNCRPSPNKHFHPGQFTVIEPDGSRHKERLETPEAMAYRLELQ